MLKITYFYRQPKSNRKSIEGIFKLVSNCLKDKLEIREFYCSDSVSRYRNLKNAEKSTTEINHITGDVNYLAIGFKGKKNIITIHDFGHYENLRKRSLYRYLIFKIFWFKLPLRNVDIVTVVSEYTKNKLIEYLNYPLNRIIVIHDPVKPIFKYYRKENLNDVPRILQIGTGPHKNLENLILAVKDMNVVLDIVGNPNKKNIEVLIKHNIKHVIYDDITEDALYQVYINCDILFFASLHEGFGMPIIEAQAVGRPVITSNFGAMLEVAKDSAVLVNPYNPQEIREAIQKLLSNRHHYNEYVERGLKNIIPYNHEIIADAYFKLYNELMQV